MIILNATNQKITIDLAQNVTTNQLDWTVSYIDITSGIYTPSSATGTTNNTTDVDMVVAPSTSHQRQIKFISVFNNDTTSKVVIIKKVNGANTRIICKIVLGINDTLQYTDSEGFTVIDPDGMLLTSASTLGISAGTQSISGANTVVFSNSNGISFGMLTNNVITASVSSATVNFFDTPHNQMNFNSVATSVASANIYLQRVYMPFYMTATRADVCMLISGSSAAPGTLSYSIGVYGKNGSYMSRLTEGTYALTWTSGGNSANSSNYNGISGTRFRSVGTTYNFTPGEYYFAFGLVGSTASTAFSVSMMGINAHSIYAYGYTENISGNGLGANIENFPIFACYYQGSNDLPPTIDIGAAIGAANANIANYPFRNPYIRFLGVQ